MDFIILLKKESSFLLIAYLFLSFLKDTIFWADEREEGLSSLPDMKSQKGSFSSREPVLTKDGSHSLYVRAMDEFYHSSHGAIQESLHVFLKEGLEFFLQQKPEIPSVRILEVGFGTGLNVYLTLALARKKKLRVDYTSLETVPLDWDEVRGLNYSDQYRSEVNEGDFHLIHEKPFGNWFAVEDGFSILKLEESVHDHQTEGGFDVIYYDAFAPRAQPEMWVDSVFDDLYAWTEKGGGVVTYCAKGSVKRGLRNSGFEVETIPGPPGKREMTRAIKND